MKVEVMLSKGKEIIVSVLISATLILNSCGGSKGITRDVFDSQIINNKYQMLTRGNPSLTPVLCL
jgi:hypothetical protein